MRRFCFVLIALGVLLVLPAMAAASTTDIPGVPLPVSPVMGYLDADAHNAANVFSLPMRNGDRLSLTLNGQGTLLESGNDMELAVFAPDAMSIDGTNPVQHTYCSEFPGEMSFSASSAATYYVAVICSNYVHGQHGNYSLGWTCQSPTITALTSKNAVIKRGASRVLKGSLGYAVEPAPLPSTSVTLQGKTSKWATVATATTDGSGHFSFKVKPKKSTSYRVVCAESSTLLSSMSQTLRVTVH
jgi:hypothetical protein